MCFRLFVLQVKSGTQMIIEMGQMIYILNDWNEKHCSEKICGNEKNMFEAFELQSHFERVKRSSKVRYLEVLIKINVFI